ncbi:MAG: hypothetical protein GOU99_01735 [Candidatus Altiarchaeota archaeon]|nr:hypothetical protein [Candidatus Altiarchaeota archaeon]
MKIPGYDSYSFPTHPDVLYLHKSFMLDAGLEQVIKTEIEFIVKEVPFRTRLFQKNIELPKFLIQVDKGLMSFERAASNSAKSMLNRIIMNHPTGTIIEPDVFGPLEQLSSAFSLLPVQPASVSLRIPVLNPKSVTFVSKLGDAFGVGAALFRKEPEGYGFLIASELGFMEILNKIDRDLNTSFKTS